MLSYYWRGLCKITLINHFSTEPLHVRSMHSKIQNQGLGVHSDTKTSAAGCTRGLQALRLQAAVGQRVCYTILGTSKSFP